MILNNNRGTALILTLMVIVVLLIFGGVFVLRSVNEWNSAQNEKKIAEAYYIAEAAKESGFYKIDELINTYMYTKINNTNPQKVGNQAKQYVNNDDGLGFLYEYVVDGGAELLTLDGGGTEATYSESTTSLGSGAYVYDIVITEKADPSEITNDIWDFPYNYEIRAVGSIGSISQKVYLVGDFTVRVQRDNFAKYALFTDHHTMKPADGGANVWFTDKTNFAGPIHTNERYNFAFNPSGIFESEVTQHLSKARFYNNGSPILLDADNNSPRDVPTFNDDFDRGYDEIVLESSVHKADLYEQARGTDNTTGDGIFIENNGTSITAGIYIHGNSTIEMGVDGSDNATYTIVQGSTTKIVTVDIPNNQTSIETVGVGTDVYQGKPDGLDDLGTIIYVDGHINSFKGTVQRDTEVTVSAENDITISGDILYSEYTPAVGNPGDAGYVPPNADGKTNLLGIISWGEDVQIGTTAPDDVNVHGIVMARNGVFQVDNYNKTDYDEDGFSEGPRGTATLLGGAITQFYGAFGLFNGSTGSQISGYGRNFIYDSRTQVGKSPPYFPSMKTFIAFTNDITDRVAYREGDF